MAVPPKIRGYTMIRKSYYIIKLFMLHHTRYIAEIGIQMLEKSHLAKEMIIASMINPNIDDGSNNLLLCISTSV